MTETWTAADLLALDVIAERLDCYDNSWMTSEEAAVGVLTALREAGVWVMAETGPPVVDRKAPNGEWASGGPHVRPRLTR